MEQIKIIKESLEAVRNDYWGSMSALNSIEKITANHPERMQNSIKYNDMDSKVQQINKALTALAQLEIGMQSVSERSIDIPIEQPTVNELSQIKPSHEEIRNKAINEVADSYHGEMANYFCKKANNEKLAGIKEDYFVLADKHREYQNDIKNQVWLSNNLKP